MYPKQTHPTLNNVYLWTGFLILVLPLLLGLVIVALTFTDAREDVRVWRGEFQQAMDLQCPGYRVDIVDGDGTVYLDGYREQYQWLDDNAECYSNGTTTTCSCRLP